MNPDRLDLLQTSLVQLQPVADQVAKRFYDLLFDRDPAARALFDGVDMAEQSQKFIVTLAGAIRGIDRMHENEKIFRELGRAHADLGVTDAQYDTVRDALMDALKDTLGDDFDDELRVAWSEAYSRVAAVMKGAVPGSP